MTPGGLPRGTDGDHGRERQGERPSRGSGVPGTPLHIRDHQAAGGGRSPSNPTGTYISNVKEFPQERCI